VLPWVAAHVRARFPEVEVLELGGGPVRAPDEIAAHRALVDRAHAEGRTLRAVGQAPETDPRAWDERIRVEAAYQHGFAGAPVHALCVYDRRTTPPEALATALLAHPDHLVEGRVVVNDRHVLPLDLVGGLPTPPEPLQGSAPVFALDDATSLTVLRRSLAAVLRGRMGSSDADHDMHLAASEIAANAFRHGVRPVSARVWASAERVVVTICDTGRSFDGRLSGYRPAHGDDLARGGMGVWLARKLCDHVDLTQTEHGLTVRLTTAVRRPA
jgi:anti-sigma regulatory factor (Ser/Thr protein kinase)